MCKHCKIIAAAEEDGLGWHWLEEGPFRKSKMQCMCCKKRFCERAGWAHRNRRETRRFRIWDIDHPNEKMPISRKLGRVRLNMVWD